MTNVPMTRQKNVFPNLTCEVESLLSSSEGLAGESCPISCCHSRGVSATEVIRHRNF